MEGEKRERIDMILKMVCVLWNSQERKLLKIKKQEIVMKKQINEKK